MKRTLGLSHLVRSSVSRSRITPLFQIACRSMFIQTASTPNPLSLKFLPGRKVLEEQYGSGMDFRSVDQTANSPLAKLLFKPEGVTGVFFGPDFISVTKTDGVEWAALKPRVFEAIMNFYSNEKNEAVTSGPANEHGIQDGDSELVAMIKELLDTRIRPAVQEDGGDIFFEGFDEESGIVSLRMAGSCSGCPSSSVTLKHGVQNMLMHYVPEVKGIKEVEDEALKKAETTEFGAFEKRLAEVKGEKSSEKK